MRVTCTTRVDPYLTFGRIYTVLGIQFDMELYSSPQHDLAQRILFIIVSDSREFPSWWPASLFEVSDPRLSRHWVWGQTEAKQIILSHPSFVQSDLLWRLHETDFWSEVWEQDVTLYKSVLWDLLNEFGVLPHEKRLLPISEADEWLSQIQKCLNVIDKTMCEACLSRLFNRFSQPESLHKEVGINQVKWTLIEYIFGLFVSGQLLGDAECLQEVKDYLEGKQPFCGIYLNIPYLANVDS